MKNALKLIAMLLFAWAMASCTKENDPGNGSGNGNGTGQFNYSYGYYHPAKKIKEVIGTEHWIFEWNGDDLSSIKYSHTSVYKEYHFEYDTDGRISCVWDSTDMDNPLNCTYNYYSNRIEVRGRGKYNNEGISLDYKIVNDEVYCRDNFLFGEFHLVGHIHDIPSNNYDQANNPFKDLVWFDFMFSYLPLEYNHGAWSFHNRITYGNTSYRYDYDNDNYPTICWETNPNSNERKQYTIRYYPMGGNSGYGSYNGHDYVDLGLPSGTLWATCDLGADSPEACGNKYAWGETSPKSGYYSWSNYKYCNGSEDMLTKYCSYSSYGYNGYEDNLTILQPDDDAATVNWGNGWRTPTEDEFSELRTMCYYGEDDGDGTRYIGPNGNSIFLSFDVYPNGEHEHKGVYWTSEIRHSYPYEAYLCVFGDGHSQGPERYRGYRIRPVTARQR